MKIRSTLILVFLTMFFNTRAQIVKDEDIISTWEKFTSSLCTKNYKQTKVLFTENGLKKLCMYSVDDSVCFQKIGLQCESLRKSDYKIQHISSEMVKLLVYNKIKYKSPSTWVFIKKDDQWFIDDYLRAK